MLHPQLYLIAPTLVRIRGVSIREPSYGANLNLTGSNTLD
jgi:hypothetical protein